MTAPDKNPLQKIGKYEILEKIGQGAMGVVYRARDPLMERIVALKTMSTDLDAAPDMRARFLREARSAGQLSHKNIITIFELGEEDRRAYMVMEFVEGEDLKTRIARGQRMSLEDKLRLVTELAEGLAHAHQKKVIHRDIKPGNIYITASGAVKILDFGLAHVASSDITKTGSVLGTPNYMSPEQVRGDKVDHRSDLFSTGALLYELLTGRKPFSTPTLHATLLKILEEDPEAVDVLEPSLPSDLSSIVKRCLAKDPAERYQHADDLVKDLERVRRALGERLTRLQDEAREAVSRLDVFIKEHQELLRQQREQQDKADETVPGSSEFPLDYQGVLEVRDRARRKYDELRLVAQRYESAASAVAEAARLEKRGDLEGAVAAASHVLIDLPYHTEAGALVRRLSEVIARRAREEQVRRETASLLEEAKELQRRGALAESLDRLDRVMALAPEHSVAAALHKKVAQAIDEQQRAEKAANEKRRRAEEALASARQAETEGDFKRAIESARAVLAERAEDPEARQILERAETRLRAQKEREDLERRASSLLSEAEKLAVTGDYTAAASVLRRADQSVTGVRPALERYQESARVQQEARERVRKIEDHLARGRQALERGRYAACEEEMSRVLALSPGHVEAVSFLATARQRQVEQRESEQRQAEQRKAEQQQAEQRQAEQRKAEQRQAEQRKAEQRQAEQQQAEQRQAEQRRAEQRQAEQRKAEQRKAEQRKADQREEARLAAERRAEAGSASEETVIVARSAVRPPADVSAPVPSPSSGGGAAKYLLAAVLGVLVLAGAFVIKRALTPASPATPSARVEPSPIPPTSLPLSHPSPAVSSSPAISENARALAEATRLLESRSFAEAAQAARAILARAPGNEEAATIEKKAQGALDAIADGRRRARSYFEAGHPEQATAALLEVLKLAPDDPESRELATQLDRYASKQADAALVKAKDARSRAQQTHPELAPDTFETAKTLEAEGQRLFKSRQFSQAVAKLTAATDAYGRTEAEAKAEAERQRAAAEAERQRTAEAERQKAAEAERQRLAEIERQRAQRATPSPTDPPVDEAAQEARKAQEAARQDRLAIQALIQRYKASVEARDWEALKATWPTAPAGVRQGLQLARSWRVDLQPTGEPQITGDTASVTCQRRDEMVSNEGMKNTPKSITQRFNLRKKAGSWIIEGIQ